MASKNGDSRAPLTPGDFWCVSIADAPVTEQRAAELARVFAALADPVRLRLMSLVAAQDEVCSCDLEEPLGRTQPTISHHTRVLAEAGLLIGERRGRWMWWRLSRQRLADIRAVLSETAAGRTDLLAMDQAAEQSGQSGA